MAPARYRELLDGIAVDGGLVQARATRSVMEVSPHDGRDPDAVIRADASIVLGLAAVRAVFGARRAKAGGSARR